MGQAERNLVVETVQSMLDKESYPNIEFVVVVDTSRRDRR